MLNSIDNEVVVLEGPQVVCKYIELWSKTLDHLPPIDTMLPGEKFIYLSRLRYIDHFAITAKSDPLYEELLFSTASPLHLYEQCRSAGLLDSNWIGEKDQSAISPFSDEARMVFDDNYPG